MLTKIASYAPKALVREITKRTTCLEDVWAIAREWAGIHSYGTKHLEYYKVKTVTSKKILKNLLKSFSIGCVQRWKTHLSKHQTICETMVK